MFDADITIIGAGIIGLSIAWELRGRDRNIVIVEREAGPGRGISSRNSEVLHAGIYYPPGSLKARLCVEGRHLLQAFCQAHHIPQRLCGKVIVASSPAQEASLADLYARGRENGAAGLTLLGAAELKRLEPHVHARQALYSPQTGILDVHRLIRHLEALCLAEGVTLLYRTCLVGLEPVRGGYTCRVRGRGIEDYTFTSAMVINACGLGADRVAELAGIDIHQAGYAQHLVKGEYFRVRPVKAARLGALVYPNPLADLSGLGIHATKDLAGQLKLGPSAFVTAEEDYAVDPAHAREFYENARTFLPFLEPDDLSPDMAGIRPQLKFPREGFRDFVIAHEGGRGLEGLINLIGIESPGLTASPAIARMVAGLVGDLGL